jgi:hypothetical protein
MSDDTARTPWGSEAEPETPCMMEGPSDGVEKASGGLGGSFTRGTRDVRLVALALQERWPIDPAARQAMVRRLEDVVADPVTRPRAFLAAVKAIMGLSRINLAAITSAIQAKEHEEVLDRLDELEKRAEASERRR